MARRNPSGTMPSDRAPDTPPGKDRSGALDTIALIARPMTPQQRAEEADYVNLAINRLVVRDAPDETAYTRAMLRSMLLGDS